MRSKTRSIIVQKPENKLNAFKITKCSKVITFHILHVKWLLKNYGKTIIFLRAKRLTDF